MISFFMNIIYEIFDLLRNIKKQYYNIVNKDYKKKKYNKKREELVSSIMKKSGWNREKTINILNDAHKRIGITYAMFDKYDFHKIPIEEQLDSYLNILSKKSLEIKNFVQKFQRK